MRNTEIENLIEAYRERERKRRNELLRARLARPCSREELLSRLGELMHPVSGEGKGQILLTKTSAAFIMESAR